LEEGQTVKGVVIEVDDNEKTVTVRMGNALGLIALKDMRWARKPDPDISFFETRVHRPGEVLSVGDVILVAVKGRIEDTDMWRLALEQKPKAQSALLCLETETGLVKVMVGGRDFRESQFNRAIQSRRQPGSAFKPIIYAAAIDKGYTPATMIIDSPIVFEDPERDFTWKPRNYGEKFFGPTLLRKALAKSRNVITIKILRDIGVDYAIDYARKLGITSHLSRDLSIALGSSGISLLEIVKAYSVFANGGYLVEPVFITKIVDRDGNVIEEVNPEREKVIEKNTAYIMTSLLESVVKQGTGWRVRDLKRPVAGKTGTTNNLYDAWFVGYTPRYVTGTWVGFDEEGSLGKSETGSRAASPIWLGFMKRILQDKPVRAFQVPEGVVFSKVDAESGLLPIPESEKTIFECFKEGTVPTEYAKKPNTLTEPEQFFKSDM
jgi:penicillin-binding protein 1A